MRGIAQLMVPGLLLGTLAMGAAGLAATVPDPVAFSAPQFVVPPQVLLGDAGDGRCPDAGQPCLKGVDDLLFGRSHLLRSDDLVLGYQFGAVQMLTQNSTVTSSTSESLTDGSAFYTWPAVVGARMFDTAGDLALTLVVHNFGQDPGQDPTQNTLQWRLVGPTGQVATGQVSVPLDAHTPSDLLHLKVVAGDFTGDGLDEVVVFLTVMVDETKAIVATAVDPHDPSKGLKFGPLYQAWSNYQSNSLAVPRAITKATIAGHPRVVVAGSGTDTSQVCNDQEGPGLIFESFTVDPKSLALVSAGAFQPSIPEGNNACVSFINLTAGRFSTPARDQVAVIYGANNSNNKVFAIDFDPQGTPVPGPVHDTRTPVSAGWAGVAAGRFAWNGALDQAALFISNGFGVYGINSLGIISFDGNLNITEGPGIQAGAISGECASDLAVGNFDRTKTNPIPPPATVVDPNLQVAVAFSDCGNNARVRIFDVKPDDLSLTLHSEHAVNPGASVFAAPLTTVDLQGRSLRLGLPDIVTIEKQQQATLMLAAPPMHVDAVVPIAGGTQRPFNITGAPDGLFAGYTFSSASDNKTDTTTGTTWSFTAKESLSSKITYGDCDVGDCASAGYKLSAQQALEGSTTALSGSYSGVTQSLNATTGASDLLSYQNEALTIFVYPVIGRTVCPSSKPNCSDAEKLPLHVNMAGPDTLVYKEAQPGAALTWYQPPWIPGNILSYPGNAAQLKAAAFRNPADFQDLSQAQTESWYVGSGGSTSQSISWNSGGTSGLTSSSKKDYSFEADGSLSLSGGLEVAYTAEVNAELDLSGSFGFSALTDSLKSLSATQGITLSRTASFLSDLNYGYGVTTHIFGKHQPPTVVDDKTTPAGVQTFGALRTGHIVDIPPASGFWHAWYGRAPDIALNQPAHWTITLKGNDAGNDTCLNFNPGTSDYDCLSLSPRLPSSLGESIWLSEFHWMRGLFITGPNGQGPQLAGATAGDQLVLTARVHNLSLAQLPPGAKVHVRFMAIPWDSGNSVPAAASFQIGEQTLPGEQLPAFNSDTDNPNWALVSQPFDTGGTQCGGQVCDNMDLVYWVAVWAEDAGGRLVGELAQHGLASLPATGEDFLAVAAREQPYSNNLGVYNQVFHVVPKTPPVRAPTPAAGEIGAQLTLVGSSARELVRGASAALAAKVQTGGRDLKGGLEVAFYDGDPRTGGPLIGQQQLPRLAANGRYDFRVLYKPQTCGRHTVYVTAGEGSRHDQTATMKPIDVVCPDAAKLSALVSAKTGTQSARQWAIRLSNTGAKPAEAARIDGLTLTQVAGAACSPGIVSPASFPLTIGDIPVGGSANGLVTINFAGCAAAARFRVDLGYSSSDGRVFGSTTLYNQFR